MSCFGTLRYVNIVNRKQTKLSRPRNPVGLVYKRFCGRVSKRTAGGTIYVLPGESLPYKTLLICDHNLHDNSVKTPA